MVANDVDTDRAYMLVHQCKRINSPLLVVTTHAGQAFPSLQAPGSDTRAFFDRVLCDVPCSGDGTVRKNPAIWGRWATGQALTLHPLQLAIACRGAALLKPGGRLVYSTCSLSPFENESVVCELLRRHEGQLELVEVRHLLPGFKTRPGMQTWIVLDDFEAIRKERREK
ncbi:hypothetical protein EON64_11975, partial [archaeon]